MIGTRLWWTLTTAVTLAAATGCAMSDTPTPRPASPTADAVVMVIRHGEKPDGSDQGIDANEKKDKSSLTQTGWDRARGLVNLFAPAQGRTRPGLGRPRAIYAAGKNAEGDGTRTRETVAPLAANLGVTVDTQYGKGDEQALVEHVVTQPGPTLISWQHEEIPAIAASFPGLTPTPPSQWPDHRFDVVWIFTRSAGRWHFSQEPELVLPQDTATVIAG